MPYSTQMDRTVRIPKNLPITAKYVVMYYKRLLQEALGLLTPCSTKKYKGEMEWQGSILYLVGTL